MVEVKVVACSRPRCRHCGEFADLDRRQITHLPGCPGIEQDQRFSLLPADVYKVKVA